MRVVFTLILIAVEYAVLRSFEVGALRSVLCAVFAGLGFYLITLFADWLGKRITRLWFN